MRIQWLEEKLHRSKDRPLQRRLLGDAGAGVYAEAVAAARLAVGEGAASLRWLRSRTARATADDGRGRRAERARCRRRRADVLTEAAPVQRLIAELDVEVTARAEKINTRCAERRRCVGLRKIKQAGTRVARIGDRHVEPAVGCLHVDRRDRCWCGRRCGAVDTGRLACRVHGGHNFRQRLVEVRITVLQRRELRYG